MIGKFSLCNLCTDQEIFLFPSIRQLQVRLTPKKKHQNDEIVLFFHLENDAVSFYWLFCKIVCKAPSSCSTKRKSYDIYLATHEVTSNSINYGSHVFFVVVFVLVFLSANKMYTLRAPSEWKSLSIAVKKKRFSVKPKILFLLFSLLFTNAVKTGKTVFFIFSEIPINLRSIET